MPWWKRRMQTSITDLRRHVAQLQEWNRGKLSNRVKADLERKYYVKNKDLNVVIKKSNKELKLKPPSFRSMVKEITSLYKTGYFKPTKNSCLKRLREKVDKMMRNPVQKKVEISGGKLSKM